MIINFLVISFSLLAFVLCVILLTKHGKADDAKNKMIKSITQEEELIKIDDSELEKSFYQRFFAPLIEKATGIFESRRKERQERNGQVVNERTVEKIHKTEQLLRMSGMHTTYQNYNFFKTAFAIIFTVLAIGVALILNADFLTTFAIIAVGVVLAFFLPDFFLKSMVKSHQNAIKQQLPDVLDLLSVCTEAGLSFDGALLKVIEKMDGAFIDELMTVFRQMQMGISRNQALERLSDCTDIPELKTFVSAVIQSTQLGIPINNVLKVQAQQIRDTRLETAREKGNKAATIIAIPTMFFIFPSLFIVILGPTAMSIVDTLG